MLLGPYSASGMFSRNEPAPEPRPDKMEPGTGPGSFFGCVTPKTQQSRHHKSNTKLDKLGHCRHQASGLHIWVFLTFQYGATLPFMVIYLKQDIRMLSFASSEPSLTLLFSSLPLSYLIFLCSHTEINSVSKWPRDVEAAARTKPTADFLFIQ